MSNNDLLKRLGTKPLVLEIVYNKNKLQFIKSYNCLFLDGMTKTFYIPSITSCKIYVYIHRMLHIFFLTFIYEQIKISLMWEIFFTV